MKWKDMKLKKFWNEMTQKSFEMKWKKVLKWNDMKLKKVLKWNDTKKFWNEMTWIENSFEMKWHEMKWVLKWKWFFGNDI